MGLDEEKDFQDFFLIQCWWSPCYLDPEQSSDGHLAILTLGCDFWHLIAVWERASAWVLVPA